MVLKANLFYLLVITFEVARHTNEYERLKVNTLLRQLLDTKIQGQIEETR